jgi:hypothetical protein
MVLFTYLVDKSPSNTSLHDFVGLLLRLSSITKEVGLVSRNTNTKGKEFHLAFCHKSLSVMCKCFMTPVVQEM